MEIIKNFKVRHLVNILLGVWIFSWVYFALFNWDIFVVPLNINIGFGIINSYPFVIFFFIGLAIIIAIRYLLQYSRMLRRIEVKQKNDTIKMQEKDIEILQLKEMLYKMQAEEQDKKSGNLNELHQKLDILARQFEDQKNITGKAENEKDDK